MPLAADEDTIAVWRQLKRRGRMLWVGAVALAVLSCAASAVVLAGVLRGIVLCREPRVAFVSMRHPSALGVAASGRPLLSFLILSQLVVANTTIPLFIGLALYKAGRAVRRARVALAHDEDKSSGHLVGGQDPAPTAAAAQKGQQPAEKLPHDANPQRPAEAEPLDLSDEAQLAAYIAAVAADGNLPIALPAKEFVNVETAMYGFFARSLSTAVTDFVNDLVEEMNEDNSREKKLIFGHAVTLRALSDRAPFQHNPNSGVSKETARMLAGTLMETGDFRQELFSEEVERDLLANLIFFVSALYTDLVLSLGLSCNDARFETEFKDDGPQSAAVLMPKFRELMREASQDIDMDVVERELEGLPAELKLAFAGQKDLLRLVLVMGLYFLYCCFWFTECRILGRRVRPCLARPAKPPALEKDTGRVGDAEDPWSFDITKVFFGAS